MVNLLDRLGYALDSSCMGMINAGVALKKGTLWMGEKGSRSAYDIYSLQGFVNTSKMLVANMRAISLIPRYKGVFDECIKSLEAQKEIFYATLAFESTADFIEEEVVDGKKRYRFAIPRDRNNEIDWLKVFYGIGNPMDTLSFLHRNNVVRFNTLANLGASWGSFKIFGTAVNDIPVLTHTANRPKDFFIFLGSACQVYRCLIEPSFFDTLNLLKFVSNIGKIVLIGRGDYWVKHKYFIPLTIADVITQNSSLLTLFIRNERGRERRFNKPTPVAPVGPTKVDG